MTALEISAAVTDAGLAPLSTTEAAKLETYLATLLKWNAKLNLTSVRLPRDIVSRHFIESIQCARRVPAGLCTLLDYGSGAGFPGVPCAILQPSMRCTLAESQQKKAAFLREVLRVLELEAAVHAGRVETLAEGATFDVVTLRAVDDMRRAYVGAVDRVKPGGWLAMMTTKAELSNSSHKHQGFRWQEPEDLFGSRQRVLMLGQKLENLPLHN